MSGIGDVGKRYFYLRVCVVVQKVVASFPFCINFIYKMFILFHNILKGHKCFFRQVIEGEIKVF